jgi:hypothetical protein
MLHLTDAGAVRPKLAKAGVLEPRRDRCSLSMTHQDLDELELQSVWVKLPELIVGIPLSWHKTRHVCG